MANMRGVEIYVNTTAESLILVATESVLSHKVMDKQNEIAVLNDLFRTAIIIYLTRMSNHSSLLPYGQ